MGVEVACDIINLGVYRDPAITVVAMLLQITEAEGVGQIRRGHDEFRIREHKQMLEV